MDLREVASPPTGPWSPPYLGGPAVRLGVWVVLLVRPELYTCSYRTPNRQVGALRLLRPALRGRAGAES
jgi:hypothetical protein